MLQDGANSSRCPDDGCRSKAHQIASPQATRTREERRPKHVLLLSCTSVNAKPQADSHPTPPAGTSTWNRRVGRLACSHLSSTCRACSFNYLCPANSTNPLRLNHRHSSGQPSSLRARSLKPFMARMHLCTCATRDQAWNWECSCCVTTVYCDSVWGAKRVTATVDRCRGQHVTVESSVSHMYPGMA